MRLRVRRCLHGSVINSRNWKFKNSTINLAASSRSRPKNSSLHISLATDNHPINPRTCESLCKSCVRLRRVTKPRREAFLTDFQPSTHNSLSLRLRKLKDASTHFSGNGRFLFAGLSRGIFNENIVVIITKSAHPQTLSSAKVEAD